MTEVSLQEAQAQFESLFQRLLKGETVYIRDGDRRLLLLLKSAEPAPASDPLQPQGRLWHAADYATVEDLLRAMNAEPDEERTDVEIRKPGGWIGQGWVAEDFDDLPDDLLRIFYGEDE